MTSVCAGSWRSVRVTVCDAGRVRLVEWFRLVGVRAGPYSVCARPGVSRAVTGADTATPVVRALLLERRAWAGARLRDTDTTRRALDDAYDQRTDTIAEPEWVYWLDRAEIDIMAALYVFKAALNGPHAPPPGRESVAPLALRLRPRNTPGGWRGKRKAHGAAGASGRK